METNKVLKHPERRSFALEFLGVVVVFVTTDAVRRNVVKSLLLVFLCTYTYIGSSTCVSVPFYSEALIGWVQRRHLHNFCFGFVSSIAGYWRHVFTALHLITWKHPDTGTSSHWRGNQPFLSILRCDGRSVHTPRLHCNFKLSTTSRLELNWWLKRPLIRCVSMCSRRCPWRNPGLFVCGFTLLYDCACRCVTVLCEAVKHTPAFLPLFHIVFNQIQQTLKFFFSLLLLSGVAVKFCRARVERVQIYEKKHVQAGSATNDLSDGK